MAERIDGMTVRSVLPGDWYVRADFESGFGWYEGKAHEFRLAEFTDLIDLINTTDLYAVER
jgi:hypothetical protein